MGLKLELRNSVTSFLKNHENRKFTARQIAEWLMQTYPEGCRQKKERSATIHTDEGLLQQLVAEIGASRPQIQKKTPGIKTTEDRPRKYYFTEKSDEDELSNIERGNTPSASRTPAEHHLYPKLIAFMKTEYGVHCMRIDEKRSRNRRGPNGNRWLYPDVAGMENLGGDWIREVRDCVGLHSDKRTRLWSFEVKLHVNRSNVREVFFQAVSNSSWANFAYLVAGGIEGADTMKELLILTSLHGIGVIKLDAANPAESQIVIPARERPDIDWNTANRLAEENRDFLTYIENITQFYQTGKLHAAHWSRGSV